MIISTTHLMEIIVTGAKHKHTTHFLGQYVTYSGSRNMADFQLFQ